MRHGMRTFLTTPAKVLPVVFTLIVVGVVSYANWRDATRSRDASRSARSLPGRTTAVKTSRADLAARAKFAPIAITGGVLAAEAMALFQKKT